MGSLVEKVLNAARKYNALDYGFFKLLMITFGILLGVYFETFFCGVLWAVWALMIVSALWMLYKILKYTH